MLNSKQFLSILILGSTLTFTGCASLSLYEQYKPTTQENIEKQLGKDEMIAIGKSSPNASQNQEQGVVFIGKEYTYLMTKGAEPFLALIQEFPAEKLLLKSPLPIQFKFVNNTTFHNAISFTYADPIEKIPAAQLQRLKQLGFKPLNSSVNSTGPTETYLSRTFEYQGQLYKSANAAQIQHQFSKSYPIILTQLEQKSNVNVGNIASTIILTPLALSFDIITSPIWGGLMIACSQKNCFQ